MKNNKKLDIDISKWIVDTPIEVIGSYINKFKEQKNHSAI